jgi:hypothetical protein
MSGRGCAWHECGGGPDLGGGRQGCLEVLEVCGSEVEVGRIADALVEAGKHRVLPAKGVLAEQQIKPGTTWSQPSARRRGHKK